MGHEGQLQPLLIEGESSVRPYIFEPTLLASAEEAGIVARTPAGLAFRIAESWCAPGEQRIGYATVVRLVELVREFHWNRDIHTVDEEIDSITASLSAKFSRPITTGMNALGCYRVSWIGAHSYGLRVEINETDVGEKLASAELACVFWDPISSSVANPSPVIMEHLRSLVGEAGSVE